MIMGKGSKKLPIVYYLEDSMLLEYVLLEMAKLSSGKQNETHRTAELKDDF